jgi:hypothetical protein
MPATRQAAMAKLKAVLSPWLKAGLTSEGKKPLPVR